jgi:hypothetical protein
MPNRENIDQMIAFIKCDGERKGKPRRFQMARWASVVASTEESSPMVERHACGTIMCLGGTANFLRLAATPGKFGSTPYDFVVTEADNYPAAAAWMGLDIEKAKLLFTLRNEDGKQAMELLDFDMLPRAITVAAGVRVLEILRDTGRVNWSKAIAEAKREQRKVKQTA